ncbi:fatty acid-binding protein, intestinal-like [Carcharodon carcharias]|uniref:fatty acid-binding protein, intestinal-like n=1 Tax=Carcharodon carcharias TaxID=13397 RepID=UPI001B7E20C7|nr:fatty acid-binding protein, intestinal-like [Carcharodon carcharias]XP_041032490.1 fatty acid-binding protein, intestinal-like [Carcharodon carcharias]
MAFDGVWKVFENDNFEAFLIALGLPEAERKMVMKDNLEMDIKQEGNKFTIVEKSCFCTKTSEWSLNEEFENSLANGSQVKGKFSLTNANRLEGHFKILPDGKEFITIREAHGDTLVQIIKIDGQDTKRVFKKQ